MFVCKCICIKCICVLKWMHISYLCVNYVDITFTAMHGLLNPSITESDTRATLTSSYEVRNDLLIPSHITSSNTYV
jgi:hypothetical protein